MSNKKGFTVNEFLVVLLMIATISLILLCYIINMVHKTRIDIYKRDEEIMVYAAMRYLGTHPDDVPNNMGDTFTITVKKLVKIKEIYPIEDAKDRNIICSGYVKVTKKLDDDDYSYKAYLKCGNNYHTE